MAQRLKNVPRCRFPRHPNRGYNAARTHMSPMQGRAHRKCRPTSQAHSGAANPPRASSSPDCRCRQLFNIAGHPFGPGTKLDLEAIPRRAVADFDFSVFVRRGIRNHRQSKLCPDTWGEAPKRMRIRHYGRFKDRIHRGRRPGTRGLEELKMRDPAMQLDAPKAIAAAFAISGAPRHARGQPKFFVPSGCESAWGPDADRRS